MCPHLFVLRLLCHLLSLSGAAGGRSALNRIMQAAIPRDLASAFVRLAAINRTLQNQHVAAVEVRTFHPNRIRLAEALRSFQHTEFSPHLTVNAWNDPITAISDAQIKSFKPG
jgi:hypothetical protein